MKKGLLNRKSSPALLKLGNTLMTDRHARTGLGVQI